MLRRNFPLAFGALAALIIAMSPSPASADMLGSIAEPFQNALQEGSFGLALGLIFLAGLATALTPCVYPMIAITVSVFGARETKSKAEGAALSTMFVLGISGLFVPLGVISAMTGTVMGAWLTSPWVLSGLALLFIAMAASMFGAFDLALPPAIQNKLAQVGGKGYRGAFLVGFVAGLVAAPCTGPVIAVLLTWIGTTSSAAFGALAMLVYSFGLGSLFWVVGTFAVSLPKSGRWLDSIKSVFGVVMLALALYYLRHLVPFDAPPVRVTAWLAGGILALVVGLAIGSIHLSFKEGPWHSRLRKGVGVALAVGGILASVSWLEALPEGAHIEWVEGYEAARAEAEATGRPLLVDFGADWCNACNELEHEAMSDPRVVAESQRFICARVDLSADVATDEKWALLRDTYNQPGLPLVVMHGTDGDEANRVTGNVDADDFLERMQAVD